MNTQLYKTLLETERDEIMSELGGISVKDPITGSFTADVDADDAETMADTLDMDNRNEEYEESSALTETFSARLTEVNNALSKIESGNYGTCSVCGNEIEEARLQANPAATTCVADMNS